MPALTKAQTAQLEAARSEVSNLAERDARQEVSGKWQHHPNHALRVIVIEERVRVWGGVEKGLSRTDVQSK